MQIVPAILTEKKEELLKMIRSVEKFCPLAQIDIMDGEFVPTRSISAADLAGIKTKIAKEIHLMVERPLSYLKPFKDAGASRLIFHFESKDDPSKVIEETRKLGLEVGLAINPETPVAKILGFLPAADQILVMTVNPGHYGSPFLPEMVNKIAELKKLGGKFSVSVDGGIKIDNILDVKNAGADLVCVGSGIFRGNPEENYKKLQFLTASSD